MPTTKRKGKARGTFEPITQEASDGDSSETDVKNARMAARSAMITKRTTLRASSNKRRRRKAASDNDEDYLDDAGALEEDDVEEDDVESQGDDDNILFDNDEDDADGHDNEDQAGDTSTFGEWCGGHTTDDNDLTKDVEEAATENDDRSTSK